jgi:hypothetical protein
MSPTERKKDNNMNNSNNNNSDTMIENLKAMSALMRQDDKPIIEREIVLSECNYKGTAIQKRCYNQSIYFCKGTWYQIGTDKKFNTLKLAKEFINNKQ